MLFGVGRCVTSDRLLEPHGGRQIVEVEFYNFEVWTANNLQNQETDRKRSLGHRSGVGQGDSDD